MDYEIKTGDKVRIKGDVSDFTDHLDGKILTVLDEDLVSDNETLRCKDSQGYTWYIWKENILEVICDGNV